MTEPELVAAGLRQQRAEYTAHVGQYVVGAADLDETLAVVLAMLIGARTQGRYLRAVRPIAMGEKIDQLARVLPQDWRHGQKLVQELRVVNRYRNALAHGVLSPIRVDESGNASLEWVRENSTRSGTAQTPIEFAGLGRALDHLRAVSGCVIALFAPDALVHDATDEDLVAIDLGAAVERMWTVSTPTPSQAQRDMAKGFFA